MHDDITKETYSNEIPYWIGLNDIESEGNWEWTSQENANYTNWHDDRYLGGQLSPNGGTGENVAYLGGYIDGTWDDQPNIFSHNGFIPKGIAEIKLAPNNLPTGELLINGNLNVGETLTIDTSNISDIDNYEGYTPTYNYSWEISDDFGVSWNALTTEDGTDNDNSYILTSNEVGKKLRGSISYVDGYGSTESITSAASEEIIPSLKIRGNSFYVIVEGPNLTWEEAEASAVNLGGHLVTINDADEDLFLVDEFGLGYFFGLNDIANEGIFKDKKRNKLNLYQLKYLTYQPDNDKGNQDYGAYHPSFEGGWDDVQIMRQVELLEE